MKTLDDAFFDMGFLSKFQRFVFLLFARFVWDDIEEYLRDPATRNTFRERQILRHSDQKYLVGTLNIEVQAPKKKVGSEDEGEPPVIQLTLMVVNGKRVVHVADNPGLFKSVYGDSIKNRYIAAIKETSVSINTIDPWINDLITTRQLYENLNRLDDKTWIANTEVMEYLFSGHLYNHVANDQEAIENVRKAAQKAAQALPEPELFSKTG